MNLENIFNNTVLDVGGLKYPEVIFENKEMKGNIALWLHSKFKIAEKFGKVLAGLGFNADDKIVLRNMEVGRNVITFDYSINGEVNSDNKITLKYANYVFDYRLIVSDGINEVICGCSVVDSKCIYLKLKEYNKQLGINNKYTRIFDNDSAEYKVIFGDIELKLILNRDRNYIYDNNLVLEQEDKLQQYLESIVLPMSIDEIYKGISSYIDVNLFNLVKLQLSKLDIVNDMIVLRDGNCEKFMITRGDKSICVNQDGSWSYNLQSELVAFSQSGNEKGLSFNIYLDDKNGVEKYFSETIENDIDNANQDVTSTKRLVRELFTKENNR